MLKLSKNGKEWYYYDVKESGEIIAETALVIPKECHDYYCRLFQIDHLLQLSSHHVKKFKKWVDRENLVTTKDMLAHGVIRPVGAWPSDLTKTTVDSSSYDFIKEFDNENNFKTHQVPEHFIKHLKKLKQKGYGHYVYHLVDANENTFYVGYTTHPLTRMAYHVKDAFNWTVSTCSASSHCKTLINSGEWFQMWIVSWHDNKEEALQEEIIEIRRLSKQITNVKDTIR